MGFFTKKGFDQIRQDFAQLLVNYGYLNSIYDLGNPINAEWYIGRGLTTKHAMQNLYCNVKEILEPDDEIADCYA